MAESGVAAVIVLAAGQGTRMKSSIPKVMHPIAGEPMLAHVLRASLPHADGGSLMVVVGHQADLVSHMPGRWPAGHIPQRIVQAEQRGTGHAVRMAFEQDASLDSGTVVVVPGDAPLITGAALSALIERHEAAGAAVTILSATVDDATGYGRVVRDPDGHPIAIVEHRDAGEATLAIKEINSGVYAFDADFLKAALTKLSTDNDAGEEYLTDVIAIAAAEKRTIAAVAVDDPTEVMGINDRAQLAEAARILRDRIVKRHQLAGVTFLDPHSAWVDASVTIEPDVTIEPNVQLKGSTTVETGATVGPDATLIDTTVGANASVIRAHCVEAVIGEDANVGPYVYLRPAARIARRAKVGTFVEVKNSDVGEGSRVPHLTYVGDATIGVESNIGASSVFVNYDGVEKHRTVIGDHVRTGSDNTFVAPVTVGDGAYTGAGSVIREDVPPGALAVSAGAQRNIEGWVARKRPGTPAHLASSKTPSPSEQQSSGRDDGVAQEQTDDRGPET